MNKNKKYLSNIQRSKTLLIHLRSFGNNVSAESIKIKKLHADKYIDHMKHQVITQLIFNNLERFKMDINDIFTTKIQDKNQTRNTICRKTAENRRKLLIFPRGMPV